MPNSLRLDRQHCLYCCLYMLILHNAYDAGRIMLMMFEVYDLGWMDGWMEC